MNKCETNKVAALPPLPNLKQQKLPAVNDTTATGINIKNVRKRNLDKYVFLNSNGLNPDFIDMDVDMDVPEGKKYN